MTDPAVSFGRAAATYDAARPEYPAEAVQWLLDGVGGRVADVGAGTGKLTRALVAAGAEVVAVDPDLQMLQTLSDSLPAVPTFVGTAESLPLPDSALDLVVLAQAWHWVDPVTASAEVARVLRPGGTLGLVWNVRDERSPVVQQLVAVMKPSPAEQLISDNGPTIAAPFTEVTTQSWDWVRTLMPDRLRDLMRSRSQYLSADAAGRELADVALDGLLAEWGDGPIELPYRTVAFRAVRP